MPSAGKSQAPRVHGGRRRASGGSSLLTLAFFGSLAALFLNFYSPPASIRRDSVRLVPEARPAPDALGMSGNLSVRFSLPGEVIEFPLEVFGDPTELMYRWVSLGDKAPADTTRPLRGAQLLSPQSPGFYSLELVRDSVSRMVPDVTLAVKIPFELKSGTSLNGYKIGTYGAERSRTPDRERPDGFVEVFAEHLEVSLSKHFRIQDFLSHDSQKTWPRYSAVDPRILDKVELILKELVQVQGPTVEPRVSLDVHSAFRTPLYNRLLSQARESRHQYGDAMDVEIDANGDGRINSRDLKLITDAVDAVERRFPELAGGFGIYSGIKYRVPYVHIDARGTRVRWRG